MTRYESILDAVGGTPLIRLTRAAAGLAPRIYVKPEWWNPGGSVKDRAALSMLRAAEASGELAPGGTVVEMTSGNTGIGLALVAAHLGYRTVIFTSSAVSVEKRSQLAAYGAEVRLVDAFVPKSHPDSLRSVTERFVAETPGAWLARQYDNPANPDAHLRTTGPEIWADTVGAVTHLVSTVGTGGTISGTASYLKKVSGGQVRVIGADPATSSYSGGDGSQKLIEGAGHFVHPDADVDEWPLALDTSLIDTYVQVEDHAAIAAIRDLARTEGILAGGSAGVALAAAYEVASTLTADDVVVVLLPDSGRAYLSTYFNDDWLLANGLRDEPGEIHVRDLAMAVPSVGRDETVAEVVRRLESARTGVDVPLLVLHPRAGRRLAPHHSDVVGWTTLGAVRAAPSVESATRTGVARVGAGLSAESARAWVADDAERTVALVVDRGRVTGVLDSR